MKKNILVTVASLSIFAASFAQSATTPATKATTGVQVPPVEPGIGRAPTRTRTTSVVEVPPVEPGIGRAPTTRSDAQDDSMSKKLGLKSAQKTKFEAAEKAYQTAVQGIEKNGGLSATRKKALIKGEKSKHESKVQGILTADQFEKWMGLRTGMSHREG